MKELFIAYSLKKISFYDNNYSLGMHFDVEVYRMTQQKWAEKFSLNSVYSENKLCNIGWLFPHFHEISGKYIGFRGTNG